MADNVDATRANEPYDAVQPDFDQPEDDVVSLDELLDQEAPDAEPGEVEDGDAGAGQNGEAATPQADQKQQDKPLTQAEFNRAFAERSAGLRRQWEREHAEELALAQYVREAFPGKKADEIDEELTAAEARRLAEQTGWDEEEAVAKVKARRAYERQGRVPDGLDQKVLETLHQQLETIEKEDGLDFLEIVTKDPFLAEQVDAGKMDIKDAYIYWLKHQSGDKGARPAKKAPPKPETTTTTGAATGTTVWSEERFRRANEALKRGQKVRTG